MEKLLQAARTFYLNTNELIISDEEYDKLFKESGLSKSELYDMIGLTQDRNHSFENIDQELPGKIQFTDLKNLPELEDGEYDTLKYDGSSIKLIYKDGKLANILSSSGISQLRKLENKVPRSVDPSIERIYCEALVKVSDFGDGARSKANGLINSKKMKWEVDQYLHLMAVNVIGGTLDQLTELEYFHIAPKIYDIQKWETTNRYGDWCTDGVVRYTPSRAKVIYKLYYVESVEVTVEDIEWRYTDTKTVSATLRITPVTIDGYNVDHVSPNGINNLYSKGMGIGARLRVARAGQTIPKVIEVIEPSWKIEYTCECGTPLTSEDVVGNNLRCPNKLCTHRLDEMRSEFDQWLNPVSLDIIFENAKYNFFNMLGLERYNLKKLSYSDQDMVELRNAIESRRYDDIFDITSRCMGLKTDQMRSNLDYKLTAYLHVYYERIN